MPISVRMMISGRLGIGRLVHYRRMSCPSKHSINRITAGLIAVVIVFGLTTLMVLERYDPTVITTVVTGTSLAAAELVRRFEAPGSTDSEPTPQPKERS